MAPAPPNDSDPSGASATSAVAASAASAAFATADGAADSDTESAAPVDSDASSAAAAPADPDADPAAEHGASPTGASGSANLGDSISAHAVAAGPAAIADSDTGSATTADAASTDLPLLNSGLDGPSVHIFPASSAPHDTTTTDTTASSAMTAAAASGTIIVVRNNGQPSDRAQAIDTATGMRARSSWAGAVTVVYETQSDADAEMAAAAVQHATTASYGHYALGYIGEYDSVQHAVAASYGIGDHGHPTTTAEETPVPLVTTAEERHLRNHQLPRLTAIVSVSPDGNAPAPPVPPDGSRAPAPPALSDDPAPVPPCDPAPAPPPALGDSGDDGGAVAPVPTLTPPTDTAASVSLDSREPAPPVRPSGPAPVPPYDPAPAPPPASGTPGVPRLDEHILSRTALAGGTLVAADTHGAPGTAPGNAGTGDDTGATAAAVTTRRGGVEGTLHRGDTSGDSTVRGDAGGGDDAGGTANADNLPPVSPGNSVPAPSAPPGGSAPAPPSGPVLTLPGSPTPQPLTEPTPPQPPDGPVSVPPSGPAPALPPAPGAPRVPHIFLRRRDTHVLPPVDNSLTAADTQGTPGTALASADDDDDAGAAATTGDHGDAASDAAGTNDDAGAAATTGTHGDAASGAALADATPGAALADATPLSSTPEPAPDHAATSHSSHVARSNADRSCCLCVATLNCLVVCTGLAEHVSSWAGGAPIVPQLPRADGAPILAQLASLQQILAPSPPAQNPASYNHELSDGQLACSPGARPVPCQHILAPSPPARNPASYAHALPGEQSTCGPEGAADWFTARRGTTERTLTIATAATCPKHCLRHAHTARWLVNQRGQ